MRKKSIAFALAFLFVVALFPLVSRASAPENVYVAVFSGAELPSNAQQIVEDCGGRVLTTLQKAGVLMAKPVSVDGATFESSLRGRPEIIDVGIDEFTQLIPSDPELYPEAEPTAEGLVVTDYFYNRYQWNMWIIDAKPDKAWSITTGDPNVKVAILDTGIYYNHPDIAPNYDWVLSTSFVDLNFDGVIDEDPMDYNGHGTHCAGTVAGVIGGGWPNYRGGIVGVGPTLSVVNLKVMTKDGWGYFSWAMSALYYAVVNGIDVASMSFGGYVNTSIKTHQGLYNALLRLTNWACTNGLVMVASTGNENYDMGAIKPYRHIPSDLPSVIAVTGTDIWNNKASYSNYGDCLHGIAAPGGDPSATPPLWHPVQPPAWRYWYAFVLSTWSPLSVIPGFYGAVYVWMTGTSAAAPHVAGVAGLIRSRYPGFNPEMVRIALQIGALDIGKPGYDLYFNYGLVNAYQPLIQRGPYGNLRMHLVPI